MRSDPIGLNGGVNLFAYVLNNPGRYIDFMGLYCRQLTPWVQAEVYASSDDDWELISSIEKKKWRKTGEANALPIPSRCGDVAEIACTCSWELVGFIKENTYLKENLYKADFRCGIDENPRREYNETRYELFKDQYIVEENIPSLFMDRTTTTSGFYSGQGCLCPEPA